MMTDNKVTLWHYDEKSGRYEKNVYRAKVFFEDRLAKNGIKQKGYYSGSRATVRIPMAEQPFVCLGDYMRLGECLEDAPDRIADLKVAMITENYRGTNPHLKVFCGRASERS